MKAERALTFKYPPFRKAEAERLNLLLDAEGIEHIIYKGDEYYPTTFVVRKCGRKWNDIYKLINSVYAAKYRLIDTTFEVRDGRLFEVVICTL